MTTQAYIYADRANRAGRNPERAVLQSSHCGDMKMTFDTCQVSTIGNCSHENIKTGCYH